VPLWLKNIFKKKHMSLRKIVPFFVLMLIASTTTNAQNLEYGFELGLGTSTIHMSDVPQGISYTRMYNPIPTYNINAFVSYKSKSFWGVSIEPGFTQKGGIQLFDSRKSNYQIIHNNVFVVERYIQIPVLYNIYLSKRFYFSVGPDLAYRLSENASTTNTINNTGYSISAYKNMGNNVFADYILPDTERRFEMSGVLGLNCILTKKFDIGLRYGFGFNNLVDVMWADENIEFIGRQSSTHNQYLQFLMKFKI
jgi:hypothetical protein